MIRVISGIYKGKRLRLVRSPLVRPLQDKLKGALFNIIRENVPGSRFLDGFAGTGSVGLEALSRGAERAVFIEEYRPAVRILKVNVDRCEAADKSLVIAKEFNRAVIDLAKDGITFDIIFLDPPYRLLETRNPLKVIRKRGLLKAGGLLILRHYFKMRPSLNDFRLRRCERVGDDVLSFFDTPLFFPDGLERFP